MRRFTNYLTRMHKEKKIVHRDVDDGNIMIDKDGNWYLIDFGRVKRIEIGEDASVLEEEDFKEMRFTIREIYSILQAQTVD